MRRKNTTVRKEKKWGLAFCLVEIKYYGIKNTLLDHEKQQHWGTRVQLHLVWSRNSRKDPSQGKKWIDSRVSKKKKAPILFLQTCSGESQGRWEAGKRIHGRGPPGESGMCTSAILRRCEAFFVGKRRNKCAQRLFIVFKKHTFLLVISFFFLSFFLLLKSCRMLSSSFFRMALPMPIAMQ